MHPLIALSLLAMVVVLFVVPALLGALSSKWGSIGCSTLISPFLMVGAITLTGKAYWHFNHDPSGGCGGECGAASYSAGLWPLLIPVFMVPAFFVSWLVIALMKSARK